MEIKDIDQNYILVIYMIIQINDKIKGNYESIYKLICEERYSVCIKKESFFDELKKIKVETETIVKFTNHLFRVRNIN